MGSILLCNSLKIVFSSVFQRAQPEIVTFLGYESDNALYSIPGKKLNLNFKVYNLSFVSYSSHVGYRSHNEKLFA